jgi:hypothetical protein
MAVYFSLGLRMDGLYFRLLHKRHCISQVPLFFFCNKILLELEVLVGPS